MKRSEKQDRDVNSFVWLDYSYNPFDILTWYVVTTRKIISTFLIFSPDSFSKLLVIDPDFIPTRSWTFEKKSKLYKLYINLNWYNRLLITTFKDNYPPYTQWIVWNMYLVLTLPDVFHPVRFHNFSLITLHHRRFVIEIHKKEIRLLEIRSRDY